MIPMHRLHLLLAGLALLAAAWLATPDARAQTPASAAMFAGTFCPGGVRELGMPFKNVRLCPYRGRFHYIGTILLMGSKYCPVGTVEAAGQALPMSRSPALYSIIGTNFGGDGKTAFNLPDLRGRAPVANPAMVHCLIMDGDFPARR